MKKIFLIVFFAILILSCSRQEQFMVKRIINTQSIELQDGTIVKLIGVNQTNNKYNQALQGLQNKSITLYDENYDPINYFSEGVISAYVYDIEGNCINDFAGGGNSGSDIASPAGKTIDLSNNNDETQDRVSCQQFESMPSTSLSEMYERYKLAVFLIAVPQTEELYAQGTGFFVAASGIGVSNYHVFEGGNQSQAIIKTIDNYQYKVGRILKYDEHLDYIVFEVENDHLDFPYLTLVDSKTGVGEDVFAIGNPHGLEHTLSRGIVSSYRENESLIQTTAEITHGSSGGPLFNMSGQVIGITTSGIGEANLNFAMNILKLNLIEFIY